MELNSCSIGFLLMEIIDNAASWFKGDVMEIIDSALATGADPNISDAFTINGQPGDLYSCSNGTYLKLGMSIVLQSANRCITSLCRAYRKQ